MTVKDIMNNLPGAFQPDAAAGVNAVFQYTITGDDAATYTIIVNDGNLEIKEGAADNPNTTLIMDSADFIALMTGQIDGMSAFMAGKLQIDGDLMLAQTLATMFKAP